jgi:hypothetical protein
MQAYSFNRILLQRFETRKKKLSLFSSSEAAFPRIHYLSPPTLVATDFSTNISLICIELPIYSRLSSRRLRRVAL